MDWVQIVVQVAAAIAGLIMQTVKDGQDVSALLERPLSEILPHELRTTIAKKIADDAAAKKFGAPT